MLDPLPKFVTFDAAQTLVRVRWDPAGVAVASAEDCGVECDGQVAAETYLRLLQSGWSDYKRLNRARDFAQVEAWWRELTDRWIEQMGWDIPASDLVAAAEDRLYGPGSAVFSLFDDTRPCLDALAEAGVRCGVVSNWDMSLHKVLRVLGLQDRFEFVVCSDEEGYEKPDPRLFEVAARLAVASGTDVLHVGDSPTDDVQGARQAGMRALLLDRDGSPGPGSVNSLGEVPALLGL